MKLLMRGLFVGLFALAFCVPAMAHDATINDPGMSVADDPVVVDHNEDMNNPSGFLTLTTTNTGTQAWGDFHFSLQMAEGVVFEDFASGTQAMTWTVAPDGQSIDLYYYDDPVLPGESATFIVKTINTGIDDFFGVCYYPTPVPEPATMGLLTLGGLALAIRRKK